MTWNYLDKPCDAWSRSPHLGRSPRGNSGNTYRRCCACSWCIRRHFFCPTTSRALCWSDTCSNDCCNCMLEFYFYFVVVSVVKLCILFYLPGQVNQYLFYDRELKHLTLFWINRASMEKRKREAPTKRGKERKRRIIINHLCFLKRITLANSFRDIVFTSTCKRTLYIEAGVSIEAVLAIMAIPTSRVMFAIHANTSRSLCAAEFIQLWVESTLVRVIVAFACCCWFFFLDLMRRIFLITAHTQHEKEKPRLHLIPNLFTKLNNYYFYMQNNLRS